jgi:hypothetical protein
MRIDSAGAVSRPDLDTRLNDEPDDSVGDIYQVHIELKGRAMLLSHRYDCDAVEMKAAAAKGSKSKKTDDIESYLYRDRTGNCGVPGAGIKSALATAAKSMPDPRSPRKSARDLFKAAILIEDDVVTLTDESGLPKKTWDALDKRRVIVGQAAIARVRPAFEPGWRLSFTTTVLDAQYISPEMLRDAFDRAGKYIGLCDYRPECGRFDVVRFEKIKLK